MKCEICEGEGVIVWDGLTVICIKCDGQNSEISCHKCGGTGDEDPVFGGSCEECKGLGYILPGHNTKRIHKPQIKSVSGWLRIRTYDMQTKMHGVEFEFDCQLCKALAQANAYSEAESLYYNEGDFSRG